MGFAFGLLLSMVACDSEKSFDDLMEMTKTLTDRGDQSAVINKTIYTFSDGKPVSVNYENVANPEYNSNTVFQYDDDGRIIEELEGGTTVRSLSWEGDVATVTNADGEQYAEIEMEDERLLRISSMIVGQAVETFFRYDNNGNVVAVESPEGELHTEYLSFDTSKTHPSHLLKAISPLRHSLGPFFTNIFSVERVQPIEGDDFSIGLTDYEYRYTFDANGRVESIEDEASAIYTVWYSYL